MGKVKDLIKELQQLDQEKEITMWNFDTCNYNSVEVRKQQDINHDDYEIVEGD
jgi:hypothetical protein